VTDRRFKRGTGRREARTVRRDEDVVRFLRGERKERERREEVEVAFACGADYRVFVSYGKARPTRLRRITLRHGTKKRKQRAWEIKKCHGAKKEARAEERPVSSFPYFPFSTSLFWCGGRVTMARWDHGFFWRRSDRVSLESGRRGKTNNREGDKIETRQKGKRINAD
jgi:hypothetical protein